MAAMTSKRTNEGFALLVAVIFTSVMLAFALLIGALGYKQSILANAARDSQYAFFAADVALECLLYADSKKVFRYFESTGPTGTPSIPCNGGPAESISTDYDEDRDVPLWVVIAYFDFPTTPASCAKVTIHKPPVGYGKAYFFSEGYSIGCEDGDLPLSGRYTVRGLQAVK